jgi:uncharacterized membrane protein/thiol-disulfide isomerase/thioredoxin
MKKFCFYPWLLLDNSDLNGISILNLSSLDFNIFAGYKMKYKFHGLLFRIFMAAICLSGLSTQVSGNPDVVNAVLFYSPDCPHCHQLIEEILIPLKYQFPESLQIFGIDITTSAGSRIFQNYIDTFAVSAYRQGVPALIIGNNAVLAGEEIEAQASAVIEEVLSSGGSSLPAIPGLWTDEYSAGEGIDFKPLETVRDEFLHSSPPQAQPQAELEAVDKILGWSVISILAASLIFFFTRLSRYGINPFPGAFNPKIPVFLFFLILAGLAVSLYLSYVEIQHLDAFCGPVGDCTAVQDSYFSRILGFPVAVLGAIHYFIFFVFLLVFRFAEGISARILALGLILLAFTAVLYSMFLTGLEIWVIHAVCSWCLGSAVISAGILCLISKKFIRRLV